MKKIDLARNDSDLYPVLQQANDSELAMLSEILAGKVSAGIDKNERDPLKIAIELQSMGGDSIVNIFRGKGVCYREIANDAADKLGIKKYKDMSLLKLEEQVAEKLIEKYKEKLSDTERKEFDKHIKEALDQQGATVDAKRIVGKTVLGLAPMLSIVGGMILRRGAVMAIPGIGQVAGAVLAVGGVATAFTGTAYSVTIPSVLIIGTIRARIEAEKMMSELEL